MRGSWDAKQRAVACHKARQDFYFFARWMHLECRGIKWLRAPHHPVICDALTKVYRGEITRLILNLPPRYSKSILVQMFIAWTLGHFPDSEYIYTSYSSEMASGKSWEIRELVQHPSYREIFPNAIIHPDKTSQGNWRTTEGGIVYAPGMGGTIIGMGAGKSRDGFGGAVILDDPINAEPEKFEHSRQISIQRYPTTIESRFNSNHVPVIVVMQRLDEMDLAGWMLSGGTGEKWEPICFPAITDSGEALWPEKHSLEDLERMREAKPWVFAGQYMQKPIPIGGAMFKPERIQFLDAEPSGIEWVRAWDFAGTKDDGDYTVGAKMGNWDSKPVVSDIVRFRGSPDEVERTLLATASRDGPDCAIHIAQDPGQAGKFQAQYFTSKLSGYNVVSSPETGDKTTRAAPFASQVNVGNVYLVRNAVWNQRYIDELKMFPGSGPDDQVDASSRAFAAIVVTRRSFFG